MPNDDFATNAFIATEECVTACALNWIRSLWNRYDTLMDPYTKCYDIFKTDKRSLEIRDTYNKILEDHPRETKSYSKLHPIVFEDILDDVEILRESGVIFSNGSHPTFTIQIEGSNVGDEVSEVFLGPYLLDYHYRTLETTIRAPDSAKRSMYGGYIHPHVSSGKACLGNESLPYYLAARSGLASAAIDSVTRLLRSYNSADCFKKIGNWISIKCICTRTVSMASSFYCVECAEKYCEYCVRFCKSCNRVLCFKCLHGNGRCTKCNAARAKAG